MVNSFNYINVSAATSSLIKAGGGFLHSVVISNASATNGTMTVYDSVSATGTTPLVAVINTFVPGEYIYDIKFNNGLAVANTSSPSAVITFQ